MIEIDETPIPVEGPIVMIKGTDDWFTIEHRDHANIHELRPMAFGGMGLYYSGRISDADVEGTAEEMREIASAIRALGMAGATRCAVDATGEHVLFSSPRNTMRPAQVTHEHAAALATQITNELGTSYARDED